MTPGYEVKWVGAKKTAHSGGTAFDSFEKKSLVYSCSRVEAGCTSCLSGALITESWVGATTGLGLVLPETSCHSIE